MVRYSLAFLILLLLTDLLCVESAADPAEDPSLTCVDWSLRKQIQLSSGACTTACFPH